MYELQSTNFNTSNSKLKPVLKLVNEKWGPRPTLYKLQDFKNIVTAHANFLILLDLELQGASSQNGVIHKIKPKKNSLQNKFLRVPLGCGSLFLSFVYFGTEEWEFSKCSLVVQYRPSKGLHPLQLLKQPELICIQQSTYRLPSVVSRHGRNWATLKSIFSYTEPLNIIWSGAEEYSQNCFFIFMNALFPVAINFYTYQTNRSNWLSRNVWEMARYYDPIRQN